MSKTTVRIFRLSLKLLLVIFLLLITVTVFRAVVYFPASKQPLECASDDSHQSIKESDELLRRFSEALKFKTITTSPRNYDREELVKYVNFITNSKSKIHYDWRLQVY